MRKPVTDWMRCLHFKEIIWEPIGVLAPVQVRLKRIIQRDGLTEEQALLRIHAQPEDSFYLSQCDVILDGCSASAELYEQIADIVRKAG